MESMGEPRLSEACNLLEVPGLSSLDVDSDEGEVVVGIRPKLSPLPRRRSSVDDEDCGPEPAHCGSRRVSFADAKGLTLVQVKEFDARDVPKLPGYDSSEGEGKETVDYSLSPLTFSLPLSTEELFVKVRDQKLELETVELLPGTTILKGVIRVLNVSFNKAVYVRTSLDTWCSHFDLLAEYIPGSSDGLMDAFSFKLTLVPPFGERGARVDFCLRYETPAGTFWANNDDRNYVLFCHQIAKDKPQMENVNRKSCLKTVSQTFSSVENTSAVEASSQENIQAVVSKNGEEVKTTKAMQISDGQSGTSQKCGQKSQAENRRYSTRRSGRKAARMARVRDVFAQRGSDTGRSGSPPEAKQAAPEEMEKHSGEPPLSKGRSESERSQVVSESLVGCSKSLHDVLHDASPANDIASNGEPDKCAGKDLADSATVPGGESATDTPDKECKNTDKSVCGAEGGSQKQRKSCKSTSNTAAGPDDSLISGAISESLGGTVVAPLYRQMFGREGSESQSAGDWANPTLNSGDLTHTEGRESGCSVPTDVRGADDDVRGNVISTPESDHECSDATPNSPPAEGGRTSASATAGDVLVCAETLQDQVETIHLDQRCSATSEVPKTLFGDTDLRPRAENISHPDSLSAQTPAQSSHQRGEAQEDDLACDLHNGSTAESAQRAQLPERVCSQIKTDTDDTAPQTGAQEVTASGGTSSLPAQPSRSVCDETGQQTGAGEENDECVNGSSEEDGENITVLTTRPPPGVDTLLEPLNLNQIHQPAPKETVNIFISRGQIADGRTGNVEERNMLTNSSHDDETKHSAETEVSDEDDEWMTKAMGRENLLGDDDLSAEVKDADTLKDGPMSVVFQQERLISDTAEAKDWEMMVEEEERKILKDQDESEAIRLKEDTETEQGGQSEEAGTETALENRNPTERGKAKTQGELFEELTAAGENGTEAGDTVDRVGEEEIWEVVVGIYREKELEYVKTEEEEEDKEIEEKREEKKVNVGRTNVQEEEEIGGEEEMDIYLDNGDVVMLGDQEMPREENLEEENPDYKEEIVVDEAEDSESMTIEDGEDEVPCFEERIDITQNKVEDGLSAPMNSVKDKRGNEQRGNAHTPTEIDLCEVENLAPDRSQAETVVSSAAQGDSCISTGEPESDPTGHDCASAESDSDDEVELYMHCLRAVQAGERATKGRNKDAGFSAGKRPSASRGKLLPPPMPSISESLDEEPHLSCPQDNHEEMNIADVQPAAAAPSLSSGEESVRRHVPRFSCSNIAKTLLYTTLVAVFLIVAYHYDFLACFGLYLISVGWLCCQGRETTREEQQQSKVK